MKQLILLAIIAISSISGFAQKAEIYNPAANAESDIAKAVENASQDGKHVFLQIGGNWCSWCIKFHNFVEGDSELKSIVENNFEVVKVNYDQNNRNEKLLEKYGFPQRFGFPVFVVLDGNGNRIHTQNSAFLEKDKSYNRKRVIEFFKNWSATAIDPVSFKK